MLPTDKDRIARSFSSWGGRLVPTGSTPLFSTHQRRRTTLLTMGANIAASRLRKELSRMQKEPVPGIIAEPKSDANILTWFYAIRGPTQSPYEGGTYVGKLVFPKEYPMKPPCR